MILIFFQVGSLEDVYHFVHRESPSRVSRSLSSLHPKHHDLVAEEQVRKLLFVCHSRSSKPWMFPLCYNIIHD